jgi:flavin reductase (DIM6/NTAB) family NADH-FMN oxidoreductase RutF
VPSSADELRGVMRRFPAGISVITVELDGERAGLTLATLVSLSLDPPLVGFAIRRDAAFHELLRRSGRFGISLLAAGQEALAQHFARGVPPIGLWNGIDLVPDESPPLLAGAVGWLRGSVLAQHPAGTHTFFVGEIDAADPGSADRALAYVAQAYVGL